MPTKSSDYLSIRPKCIFSQKACPSQRDWGIDQDCTPPLSGSCSPPSWTEPWSMWPRVWKWRAVPLALPGPNTSQGWATPTQAQQWSWRPPLWIDFSCNSPCSSLWRKGYVLYWELHKVLMLFLILLKLFVLSLPTAADGALPPLLPFLMWANKLYPWSMTSRASSLLTYLMDPAMSCKDIRDWRKLLCGNPCCAFFRLHRW